MGRKKKFIDPIEEMENDPIVDVKKACVMVTQTHRKQKNKLLSTSLEVEVIGELTPQMAGMLVNLGFDRADVPIDVHFKKF